MQGVVIPLVGYLFSRCVYPVFIPELQGILHTGYWGAFGLNMLGVDLLYYFQHRLFHKVPWLWKFHATHHYSSKVTIWTTSRNALLSHFFFVYLLVNPLLAYLTDSPDGFFLGAMVTASLDIFRHADIQWQLPFLKGILTRPCDHHRHHDSQNPQANYAANFIMWDRLFGTADLQEQKRKFYPVKRLPRWTTMLLFPWKHKVTI